VEIAIQKIYEDNFGKIYAYFYYRTLSKEISEDLTSETFLAMARSLRGQKELQNPKSFLYGIAKNTFLNYLKQKYREQLVSLNELENLDFTVHIDEYIQEFPKTEILKELLHKYIKYLPEKQAQIIHLRLIEKLTIAEISERLGKDSNYVKTTQKRAIKSLRKIIECTPLPT
jgi:RNA polymerase sigma-70 factor (ECF subfamily)